MRNRELEELRNACNDLTWRSPEESTEIILDALAWYLHGVGDVQEALLLQGLVNTLRSQESSKTFLSSMLNETETENEDECVEWVRRSKKTHDKLRDLVDCVEEEQVRELILDLD